MKYCSILYIFLSAMSFIEADPEVLPVAAHVDPVKGHRGILVDAGSEGSRMHIFSWEPRVFKTAPPPLSFPESDEKTTDRINPGISSFQGNLDGLKDYFAYLINDAKKILAAHEEHWHTYPFYVRATGGMRLVPLAEREKIMTRLRELLSDKTFCPFFFQFDFARVISGEEEAAYAWAAANYLYGTLLPSLPGSGAVNKPFNGTFGTVDLGGASTQIAFFVPSQDVSEGLFKLQIGSQRHWNIYAKSFLMYGHNSARKRHFQSIAENSVKSKDDDELRYAVDSCLFSGYSETLPDDYSSYKRNIVITGPPEPNENQFEKCHEAVLPLLNKDLNSFCNIVYDGECSMDGFYQPKLPSTDNGHFIGSATYKYPWYFLKMPSYGSLTMFKSRTEEICSMSYEEILKYNSELDTTVKRDELVPYYCFLSTYITVMLTHGYGFTENQTFSVVDEIGGHKVGWALGSMLYEINGLPFKIEEPRLVDFWAQILFSLLVGMGVGAVCFHCLAAKSSMALRNSRGAYQSIPEVEIAHGSGNNPPSP